MPSPKPTQRILKLVEDAKKLGKEFVAKREKLSIGTIRRYVSFANHHGSPKEKTVSNPENTILDKIGKKFSKEDLEFILKSNIKEKQRKEPILRFSGKEVVFGILSDTHIGSKYFRDRDLLSALHEMEEQGCEFVAHAGDVVEGMSMRPGQIYELEDIGYTAQVDHAVRLFAKTKLPVHFITGNHCFDMETEVLTRRGFVFFDDLLDDDEVLSLDIETSIGVWSKPTAKIDTIAENDLIGVNCRTMDMLTTDGHRVLAKSKSCRKYDYTEMRDLKGTNVEIPTGCLSGNKDMDVSDDYIKLMSNSISVPDEIFEMSDEQFDLFQRGLKTTCVVSEWMSGTAYTLRGKTKELERLQVLYITHGWRANIYHGNGEGGMLHVWKGLSTRFDANLHKFSTKNTKGSRVWCLQVPMTNFMVRRNGFCYFSGNCAWLNTKSGVGIDIGEYIEGKATNMTCLGQHEGIITVNGARIMLFHGEDGSSYARSYRIQKIIEMFSGGEKPEILITGHDHKQIQMFDRNVHAFGAGCIERQSSFMRGKKMAAHCGFWICRAVIVKGEVRKITSTWYPIYK